MPIPEKYLPSIVSDSLTVRQALGVLNSLTDVPLILYVTDMQGRLLGTITDGDLRRGLLRGGTLDGPAGAMMHREFLAIAPGCDQFALCAEARKRKIAVVPLLDREGRIADFLNTDRPAGPLPIDAVLMAGGRGERLRPLTLDKPKPLLPVGDKAIIDYNVDALVRAGVRNIFVTVNYLHEQIERHFERRQEETARVRCVLEDRPLGTFGAIGLIDEFSQDDVLVMNSDLLTDIDLASFYDAHALSGAAMTVATIPYSVSVPFAILETEGGRVRTLQEKPSYNYMANAGVYLVKRRLLETLDGRRRVDATDFMESLISNPDTPVGTFPIDGTWIDIGSPSDYRTACERVKCLKNH